ncbi:MAG TPA: Panacea domain-containing protein [Verrucomicrobiae bacterium]|nr:Panacea domain-containing protein [Verrucomicrobiae bacterium]
MLGLNGGDMDKYIWIKMLYWADRESLNRWSQPITGDRTVSAPFGPILENIYDLTKECPVSLQETWGAFISEADPDANRVTRLADPGVDELSRAEISILESAYTKFKDFGFSQLKKFFSELPEHEEVGTSSKILHTERILWALGKTNEQIKKAEKELRMLEVENMLLGRQ